MSEPKGNILVVDDNDNNRDLLSRRLERKGYRVTAANGGQLALELVKSETYDLVLLDYMMPDMNGSEVLKRLRRDYSGSELPVIMVTAKGESSSVVECLELGANDYVTKPVDFPVLFARLQPQLERKMAELRLVEANRALEARVAERTNELESVNEWLVREIGTRKHAETQMRLLLESSAEGLFGINKEGAWTFCNSSCARLLGYDDPSELVGKRILDAAFAPFAEGDDANAGNQLIIHAVREGKSAHADRVAVRRADGDTVMVECWTRPIFQDDTVTGAVVSMVDITERLLVEARLSQSHKLEAVGQLAGGIAHEFNNLLMIVSGYIQRAADCDGEPDRLAEYLGEARTAMNRAGKLTKQLLVFSRKPMLENQVVEVGDLLGTVDSLLRPLIDERIELEIWGNETPAFVEIDQDQLTQALINLVINARDAIPESGSIKLGFHVTDPDMAGPDGSDQGRHVAIYVEDNGTGIDAETQKRIFEPFFTTKGPDSGSGLGLAMIYGFVRESNGFIDVESEIGKGTRFTLQFPLVEPQSGHLEDELDEDIPRGNGEVILVVEDERALRKLVSDDLEGLGYCVYTACDGPHALEVEAEFGEPIDLLVSDMVMPGFGGADVARALRQTQADMKVLLMSGYPTQGQSRHTDLPEGVPFLSKPVSRSALAVKVREILDGRSPAAPNSAEAAEAADRAPVSPA